MCYYGDYLYFLFYFRIWMQKIFRMFFNDLLEYKAPPLINLNSLFTRFVIFFTRIHVFLPPRSYDILFTRFFKIIY
jgi:hypothetical protein